MSEEEIIEKIKNTIQYDKEHRIVTIYDEKPLFRDYLQGLLDLYNKEKEKRINLEQELEKRQWVKVKENGEIEPAFYISKDRIKETIERLRKQHKNIFDAQMLYKELLGEKINY